MSYLINTTIGTETEELEYSITSGSGISHPSYGAVPNISVSSGGSGYTYSTMPGITVSPLSGSSANAIWTTNTTAGHWSAAGSNIKPSAKISLQGDGADIDLNGKSMKAWMEQVEERLNILTPNTELEKEWDELRELGERYRELEKKCKEKAKMWQELNKVQPKQS